MPYEEPGGIERFHTIVRDHFKTVVDLSTARILPSASCPTLEPAYNGPYDQTDLLLLP
jgi:hypothetical protein